MPSNSLIVIKWKENKSWKVFPVADILHMPRNHAIQLFQNKLDVVAKDGETYITNRESIQVDYKRQGKPCLLFSELKPNEGALCDVGLI